MKDCDWDSRPLYELLIEPLRERARELGYALAVHGRLCWCIHLGGGPCIDLSVMPRVEG